MKKSLLILLLFSCLGFRVHGQAKSESTWLNWQGFAEYNGVIDTVAYYSYDLFPDSTVKVNNYVGGYTYDRWHSAGQTLDPHSLTLVQGSNQYYIDYNIPYTLDTILLNYYNYTHPIANANIKDTLVFDFYDNTDLALFNYNNNHWPIVIDSFRPQTTTGWKFAKEVKYVLQTTDEVTASVASLKIAAGVPIAAGGVCGYTVTFRPGYTYSANDTLDPINGGKVPYKKLDLFSILVNRVYDTSTAARDRYSYNTSEIANDQSKYSLGFDSVYVWGSAWGFATAPSVPFFSYLYNSFFHISTVAIPNGDAGISAITTPKGPVCSGTVDSVTLVLTNYCKRPLTYVNLSYTINGANMKTFTWRGNLAQNMNDTLQLPGYDSFPAAGTYLIKAWTSNPNGGADTVASDDTTIIKLKVLATPTVSIKALGSTTVCAGDTVVLVADTGTNYTYQWQEGGNNLKNATSDTFKTTGIGTYSVMISNGTTCTATSNSIGVSVNPKPMAKIYTPGGCSGTQISFFDSSKIAYGSITGWSWGFGDGSAKSGSKNPAHKYTSDGQFTIKLTVTSQGGCIDSTSYVLNVAPAPVAKFTIPASVCQSSTINFIDSSTISSGTYSVLWEFGDGNTDTTKSTTHQYAKAGTYAVTLVASANGGCADSVTHQIIINGTPGIKIAVTGSCVNQSTSFKASDTVAGETISSYLWHFGDGDSATGQTVAHIYLNAGHETVTLSAVSSKSCANSIGKGINVNSQPVSVFGFTGGCSGSAVQFEDSSLSNGFVHYLWEFGDGTKNDTNTNPSHIYITAKAYTVSEIITTGNGCTDTSHTVVNIVNPPSAGFTGPASSICAGQPAAFTINSVVAGVNYNWNFGDKGTSTSSNPSHTYLDSGNYTVYLTASNGSCKDSTNQKLQVNPPAVSNFSSVITGTTVKFTPADSAQTTLSWNFGDGAKTVAHEGQVSHTYAKGRYGVTLTVTNSGNCTASTTDSVTIGSTGIDNGANNLFNVSIYPNPFTSSTNIEYTLDKNQDVSIEVYDMNGKAKVRNTENNQLSGKHTFTFNPAMYGSGSGMYFVKLIIGNEQVAKTVVMAK